MSDTRITVYPVGLLSDIKHRRVKAGAKYVWRQIKARNWRAVRNWVNGYLAEVAYPGTLPHTRCGRGWTKRAALRSLGVRLGIDSGAL